MYLIDVQMGIAGDMLISAFLDLYPHLIEETITKMERAGRVLGDISITVETHPPSSEHIDHHHAPEHGSERFTGIQLSIEERARGPGRVPELREHFETALEVSEIHSGPARAFAKGMFDSLCRCESKIHHLPPEKLHLHELAAPDTFADLIGIAHLYDKLELNTQQIFCTPVTTGSGTVETSHGLLPVPAPITLELLAGIPFTPGTVPEEIATPTGVVILKHLVTTFDATCHLVPKRIGYGFGTKRIPGYFNAVRLIEGEHTAALFMLETSLDDVTGETLGNMITAYQKDKIAVDVNIFPGVTKKNRPSYLLRVLTYHVEEALAILFEHTGTLGARIFPVHRHVLSREELTIELSGQPIRVKLGLFRGRIVNFKIENDDLVRFAASLDQPIHLARRIAEKAVLDTFGEKLGISPE